MVAQAIPSAALGRSSLSQTRYFVVKIGEGHGAFLYYFRNANDAKPSEAAQ